jgi:hypothetical protein
VLVEVVRPPLGYISRMNKKGVELVGKLRLVVGPHTLCLCILLFFRSSFSVSREDIDSIRKNP